MSSVNGASATRITSLYSGLDTDALVKNALSTDQTKLDKVFQNKEKATWRLSAYSELYSQVNSLRSNYLSVLGQNSVIKNGAYNAYNASITDNTALSVTATENALPTSFNIKGIVMATAAGIGAGSAAHSATQAWGSSSVNTPEGGVSGETTVAKLAGAFGLEAGQDLSFAINNKTYTFAQTAKLSEIESALSADGIDWDYTATEDAEAGTTAISSTFTDSTGKTMTLANITGKAFGTDGVFGSFEGSHTAAISRGDTIAEALRKNGVSEADIASFGEVTVNGKTFTFDPETTTLRSMMNTINTDTDADATFDFSEITGQFSIKTKTTGADSRLSISGLDAFGLGTAAADAARGSDASITLTDDTVITSASNNFTKDGITFNITDNYTAPAGSTGLRMSVTQDLEPTVTAMKKFVEDYNSLIEKLNTYYTEETFSKYSPLTEEQRDELEEKEAEKWDEKAKSGILRNDATIGSLMTELRSALTVKSSTTGLSVMDLGISTVAWDSSDWKKDQGKLQLDEDKFRAMLQENPTAVQETLTGTDPAGVSVTKTSSGAVSSSGFFTRISNTLYEGSKTLRGENISQETKSISDYEDDYDDMLAKFYEKQEALYLKYAAMEKALSSLQSQTDNLAALLGSNS